MNHPSNFHFDNTGRREKVSDTEFTMEDFFNIEVDQAQVDETLRRGLAPNGTYNTDPEKFGPFTVTPLLIDEKDDAGTVTGQRRVVLFTGRGTAKVKLKNEKTGQVAIETVDARIQYRISPDARLKRDRTTGEELNAEDSATKLYAQACKAYQSEFGERAKNLAQVTEYLRDYSYGVRMGQIGVPTKANPEPDGEPSNFVFALTARRK